MVSKVLYSSEKTDWETPRSLFEELDKEFHFDLDAAASKENTKCKKFFTKEDNALGQDWYKDGIYNIFINPPYSRALTGKFVEKCYKEYKKGATIVALLFSRTDTKWFHKYIYNQPNVEIRFIKGRVKFELGGKSLYPAPAPSMIVIFRGSV